MTDVIAIGVVVVLALVIQLIQFRMRRAIERGSGAADQGRGADGKRTDVRERVVVKDGHD